MYTFGSSLEFPAFEGRHFSLKVLNSPQVMHHVPFVKNLKGTQPSNLHDLSECNVCSKGYVKQIT